MTDTAAPRIRPARPDDAGAFAAVQVASWKSSYRGVVADSFLDAMSVGERPAYWRGLVERGEGLAWVAEDDEGAVVGFVIGGANRRTEPYAAPFTAELYSIYLLERHQRGGTGTRLVRALVSGLLERGERSMVVMTLERNPSRAFYEQLGGRLLGGEDVEIGGEVRRRGVRVGRSARAGPAAGVVRGSGSPGGLSGRIPRAAEAAGYNDGKPRKPREAAGGRHRRVLSWPAWSREAVAPDSPIPREAPPRFPADGGWAEAEVSQRVRGAGKHLPAPRCVSAEIRSRRRDA